MTDADTDFFDSHGLGGLVTFTLRFSFCLAEGVVADFDFADLRFGLALERDCLPTGAAVSDSQSAALRVAPAFKCTD